MLQVMFLFNMLNPLSSFSWSVMIGMNKHTNVLVWVQVINTIFTVLAWFTLIHTYGLWGGVVGYFTILLTIPLSLILPCRLFYIAVKLLIDLLRLAFVCMLAVTPLFIIDAFSTDTYIGFILFSGVFAMVSLVFGVHFGLTNVVIGRVYSWLYSIFQLKFKF